MKKLFFLILWLLCFASTGCSSDHNSASDIMARVSEHMDTIPDCCIYIDTADPASENYISPEDFGYLYYNEKSAPDELKDIESYCLMLSKSERVFEIHIIKARYTSDTDKIERMLNRRSELVTSSQINPNESGFFGEMAKECKVFSKGKFVFLAAGEDISSICKAIEKSV